MSSFQSVLPNNKTPLEAALEHSINTAFDIDVPLQTIWDPMKCPEHLLGWLAWAFSVDYWDDAWASDVKRRVIAESISVHQMKGTLGSVKRALIAVGFGEARVVEGYRAPLRDGQVVRDGSRLRIPSDHWAEYRIFIDRPITVDQAEFIKTILAHVTPVRCHLKGLFFSQASHRRNGVITRNGQNTRGVV